MWSLILIGLALLGPIGPREPVERRESVKRRDVTPPVAVVSEAPVFVLAMRNGENEVTLLAFEEQAAGLLRPMPTEGPEAMLLGDDPFLKPMRGGNVEPPALEPMTGERIEATTHDAATLYVQNGEFAILLLWSNHRLAAALYAVKMDGGETEMGNGPIDAICAKLYDACIRERTEYWVVACVGWLWFCPAR